ncbi:MAG TPA: hypothetical protein VIQ62_11845 [Burkholderiales bacterium]
MNEVSPAPGSTATPAHAGKRYVAPWVGWIAVAVVAALSVLTVILKA